MSFDPGSGDMRWLLPLIMNRKAEEQRAKERAQDRALQMQQQQQATALDAAWKTIEAGGQLSDDQLSSLNPQNRAVLSSASDSMTEARNNNLMIEGLAAKASQGEDISAPLLARGLEDDPNKLKLLGSLIDMKTGLRVEEEASMQRQEDKEARSFYRGVATQRLDEDISRAASYGSMGPEQDEEAFERLRRTYPNVRNLADRYNTAKGDAAAKRARDLERQRQTPHGQRILARQILNQAQEDGVAIEDLDGDKKAQLQEARLITRDPYWASKGEERYLITEGGDPEIRELRAARDGLVASEHGARDLKRQMRRMTPRVESGELQLGPMGMDQIQEIYRTLGKQDPMVAEFLATRADLVLKITKAAQGAKASDMDLMYVLTQLPSLSEVGTPSAMARMRALEKHLQRIETSTNRGSYSETVWRSPSDRRRAEATGRRIRAKLERANNPEISEDERLRIHGEVQADILRWQESAPAQKVRGGAGSRPSSHSSNARSLADDAINAAME